MQSVSTHLVKRLPLADQLGSEEDMRKVIQALSDLVQDLQDRLTVIENLKIIKNVV